MTSSCARRLIPSQRRMIRWYNRFLYGNLETHWSQIWKKIINQFHTGKLIWIYHLERGTILSHPQSNAAKTWLPFQVCKLLYLIQISPEVRNEIENVVFKIEVTLSLPQRVNTSRQRQYGRYFADDDFKLIFKYDNCICKMQIQNYILRCRLQNRSYFASTTMCKHIETEKYMAAILQTIVWK